MTDEPLRIDADISDLEITLSTASATLDLRATGQRAAATTFVAFSDDSRTWGPYSRFIRRAPADAGGHAILRGVVPGRYRVVAVGELAEGDETDPARLARWRETAATVDVVARGVHAVDVVTPLP